MLIRTAMTLRFRSGMEERIRNPLNFYVLWSDFRCLQTFTDAKRHVDNEQVVKTVAGLPATGVSGICTATMMGVDWSQ
jgi:hypothetical protein